MTKIVNKPVLRPDDFPINPQNPFEKDIFGRKKFADKLTDLVKYSDNDGLVISIDGWWGAGKSVFIKQWCYLVDQSIEKVKNGEIKDALISNIDKNIQLYNDKNYKKCTPSSIIYFDAFENEFHNNSFSSLCYAVSEFKEQNNFSKIKDGKPGFIDQAKLMTKTVVKKLPAAAIKIVTFGTIDTDSMNELTDQIAAGVDEAINKLSSGIDEIKESIDNLRVFKDSLKNIAAEFKNKIGLPLTIVVDELDRCKPTFALSFIETLKHFFDVPNLVFILVVQKKQLHESVCNRYGNAISADRYLQKFIHVDLELPSLSHHNNIQDYKNFSKMLSVKYKIKDSIDYISQCSEDDGIIIQDRSTIAERLIYETVAHICFKLKMSLREMERVYTSINLFYFLTNVDSNRAMNNFVIPPFLACLKIGAVDEFNKITSGKVDLETILSILNVNTDEIIRSVTYPIYNIIIFFIATKKHQENELFSIWKNNNEAISEARNHTRKIISILEEKDSKSAIHVNPKSVLNSYCVQLLHICTYG
jgi:hypothetical protein